MIAIHTHSQIRYWTMFGILCCCLALWRGLFPMVGFVAISMVWFFSYHLKLGWYILVFLSPMIHWFFRFSDYWYLFTDYPQLLGIYAPIVDFWAGIMVIAWGVSLLRQKLTGVRIVVHTPALLWFLLFFGSAVLSLTALRQADLFGSLYQIIRQLVLVYIGFMVLGANILRTKKDLYTALRIFLGVSVFGACMGIISFITGMSYAEFGYIRAIPFAIGAWAPFGYQHIFLGETITVGLPIAIYFWYQSTTSISRRWYRALAVLLTIVALLTLSRAAWLVLIIEGVLLLALVRPTQLWKRLADYRVIITIGMMLMSSYFGYFLLANPNVASSTDARWLLSDVSMYMFEERPILGHGFWSFQTYADNTLVVQREIGGGQDAHGMVQKVLSEQGIVGAITGIGFLLFFVSAPLRALWFGSRRPEVLLSLFLMLSPILFQLFSTQYYTSKMWIPIILGYMLYTKYHKIEKKNHFLT